MEVARVAVKKGHKVTLFEQKTSLGGQLEIASVPPRKEEMRRFTNYLSHCMKQEGITLRLGEAATPEKILDLKPDHVIVAAGANSARFPINGMDRRLRMRCMGCAERQDGSIRKNRGDRRRNGRMRDRRIFGGTRMQRIGDRDAR